MDPSAAAAAAAASEFGGCPSADFRRERCRKLERAAAAAAAIRNRSNLSSAASKRGTILGRTRANPLSDLAGIVWMKLQTASGHSHNLLQIATEIHNEAKDKHNTTLRRIYDVVNVLEGAGFILRNIGESSGTSSSLASQRQAKPKKGPSARNSRSRWRKSTQIKWFVPSSQEATCDSREEDLQDFHLLEREKCEAAVRVQAKKEELEALHEEYLLHKNLICRNQKEGFDKGAAEEDSPFDELLVKSTSQEVVPPENPIRDGNELFQKVVIREEEEPQDEEELLLATNEQLSDVSCSGNLAHLHLPFVILSARPETNIEISMDNGMEGNNPVSEVQIQLDGSYSLYGTLQLMRSISAAFLK